MASGWKSQRGMVDKSQGHKLIVGGHNSRSDSADRGEVPQRPPTVGQELPNNLVPVRYCKLIEIYWRTNIVVPKIIQLQSNSMVSMYLND